MWNASCSSGKFYPSVTQPIICDSSKKNLAWQLLTLLSVSAFFLAFLLSHLSKCGTQGPTWQQSTCPIWIDGSCSNSNRMGAFTLLQASVFLKDVVYSWCSFSIFIGTEVTTWFSNTNVLTLPKTNRKINRIARYWIQAIFISCQKPGRYLEVMLRIVKSKDSIDDTHGLWRVPPFYNDSFQEREAREMFDETTCDERIPLTDSPKDESTNKN